MWVIWRIRRTIKRFLWRNKKNRKYVKNQQIRFWYAKIWFEGNVHYQLMFNHEVRQQRHIRYLLSKNHSNSTVNLNQEIIRSHVEDLHGDKVVFFEKYQLQEDEQNVWRRRYSQVTQNMYKSHENMQRAKEKFSGCIFRTCVAIIRWLPLYI